MLKEKGKTGNKREKGVRNMVDLQLIERIRKEKGLSREYIADCLGYKTVHAYCMKITGKRTFKLKDLIKLSEIYNMDIKELIL